MHRLYAKNNNDKYAILGGEKGRGQELERNLGSFSRVGKEQSIQCSAKKCNFLQCIYNTVRTLGISLIIVTWLPCSQFSDVSTSQLSLLSLFCLWNVFATFSIDTNCITASTLSSSSDSWERGKFVRTFLRF